jgi:HAD superfamily hydrolase (TIGR01549 family)
LSPTLLIDLDDTLLRNKIDTFLPQYLASYAGFVAEYIDADTFVHALIAGTQAMARNRVPDCSLKEVFNAVFFPLTGADPVAFQAEADRFYAEIFPGLRSLTGQIPGAKEFVDEALRRGYRLAITTNPLFPRTAILQRLEWAGFPLDRYSFNLITSYETFHFAKPDPAYFAEALGRIGGADDAVVVVGDDLERDIAPASSLGLPSYWVGAPLEPGEDQAASGGSLYNFFAWLDQSNPEELHAHFNTPASWLATLRATPAALHGHTLLLQDAAWTQKPAQGEWSLTEILCHLRDVDQEVNLPRLQKVVASENPFIPGQDTDPWADSRQYHRQDGKQALHQLIHARQQIVALLEALEPGEWQRPARHAIFGPTRLQELVDIITAHDRLHLQQVYQLLKVVSPQRLNV